MISNIGHYEIMFGSFLHRNFLLDLCSTLCLFIFYVYGCTVYMLYPWKLEEGIRTLGPGITDG